LLQEVAMMPKGSGRPVDDLEALARARFPDLSQAELKLLRAAPKGEVAWCGPSRKDDDPANDPAKADEWGHEREIRADLIRWLCVDRDAASAVDPKGIQVHAARITGALDLSFVSVAFPLLMWRCRLTEDADLTSTDLPALNLAGSRVRSVTADGANVKGGIFLRDGFSAEGEVRLAGAQIGGGLDCSGGTLKNGAGEALSADGATVKGSVFLRYGFSAEGEVRLLGARIEGDLDCSGGTFKNPGKNALSFHKAKVEGGVYLGGGFAAGGQVGLLGAQIRRDLDCTAGTFKNPHKRALSADQAAVGGSVFLKDGFSAEGEVRLLGAQIGGNVDCGRGTFKNAGGDALRANGAGVRGSVFLGGGFSAEGNVGLPGTHIEGDLNCNGGTFRNGGGTALECEGAYVMGSVALCEGFRAEGGVRLLAAQIGGVLACRRGAFKNPGKDTLSADGADVKGGVFLRDGFAAEGEVRLLGARIGGSLDCSGGTFKNPGKDALGADGAVVGGEFFLNEGFSAEGVVRLLGAQIGGNLDCSGGTFENPGGVALGADRAKVQGGVFLRDGLSAEGDVRLPGVQIGGNLACVASRLSRLIAETSTVKGDFFWLAIKDPQATTLDLRNASAASVIDDEKSWPKPRNLVLDGFVYGHISGNSPRDARTRLAWLALQVPFTPQPYRQLARVLRESGDEDGAVTVLREMERLRRQQEDRTWPARVGSGVLRLTIGYGYNPLLAVYWIAGLTGLGWILYRRSYLAGSIVPTEKDAYEAFKRDGRPPQHYTAFAPLVYSLENSLPLVKLGQGDTWHPESNADDTLPRQKTSLTAHASPSLWAPLRRARRWLICRGLWPTSPKFLRWFLWIQILLGWLLATLFLAGVTGVVRKE
jgi:hypothetical protein